MARSCRAGGVPHCLEPQKTQPGSICTPTQPWGPQHPSGQSQVLKGPWSHQERDSSASRGWRGINRRRGLFLAGHSVPPPSLSPPASPWAMEGAGSRRGAAGMARSQRCRHRSGDADFPNTQRSEGRRSPGAANSPAPANQQPALNWHISAWLGSLPRREPRRPWPPVPSVGTERGRAGTLWGHPQLLGLTASLSLGCSHGGATTVSHPAAGVTRVTRWRARGVTLARAPRVVSLPTCQRESKELPRTPQPFLLISLTPLPRCIVTVGCN